MTLAIADWSLSEHVPERTAATCLYDSAGWLRAWERIGIERRTRQAYLTTEVDGLREPSVLPLYEVALSPFWHGYEAQVGLLGRLGSPVIFAGSPYSMYSKRGRVPAPLVRGAHATAMEWIDRGEADVLVAINVTCEGAADWVAAAGEPVGKVLLERTYSTDLAGDFRDHLRRLAPGVRRDVERRLRRSHERGLRMRILEGPAAHELVRDVFPLTVDTSDKNEWPALFDEEALHGLLRVPGAIMATAQVGSRLLGAFFGFRHGAELTLMCGGVDYSSLREFSTYVAMLYRATEWAYEQGVCRIEWGRDNYRFKERHGMTGTDLWALVYAPGHLPELGAALTVMHDTLSAYIGAS
jgi:Acetyltransferase (GNAT) domain